MARYAKGTHAVGICARSGRKMALRDMVPDGEFPNLLVDPAWKDEFHPQKKPVRIEEGIALKKPSPDLDDDSPGDSGQTLIEAMGWDNTFGGGT